VCCVRRILHEATLYVLKFLTLDVGNSKITDVIYLCMRRRRAVRIKRANHYSKQKHDTLYNNADVQRQCWPDVLCSVHVTRAGPCQPVVLIHLTVHVHRWQTLYAVITRDAVPVIRVNRRRTPGLIMHANILAIQYSVFSCFSRTVYG